jgi:hypothetical protein
MPSFSLPCRVWLCLVSLPLLKGWFGINCNAMLLFFFSYCNPNSVAIGLQHQNVEKLSAIEEHAASAVHSWPLTVSTSKLCQCTVPSILGCCTYGLPFHMNGNNPTITPFPFMWHNHPLYSCQTFQSSVWSKHIFFSNQSIITTKWPNMPHLKSVDTCP